MSEKDNIRAFRILHRFTQDEIAKKLNISKTSYNNKENGKTAFTLKEAKKLSEIFNRSIEEIFFADEVNFMNT